MHPNSASQMDKGEINKEGTPDLWIAMIVEED